MLKEWSSPTSKTRLTSLRLILQQDNELGRKIVEIDARPSDCLALATAQKRPIYVAAPLFEQVEDMTEVLDRINENRRGNRRARIETFFPCLFPASMPEKSASFCLRRG